MSEEYDVDENSEGFKEKVRKEREFLLEEKRAQEGLDFQKKREEKKKKIWDWVLLILAAILIGVFAFIVL